MKRLRIAAKQCNYQELHRQVKQQFIYGINNHNMQIKVNSELTSMQAKLQANRSLYGQSKEAQRSHSKNK